MKNFLFIYILFYSLAAFGQGSSINKAFIPGENLIDNPGAEFGTARFINIGSGTLVKSSVAAFGNGAVTWDAAVAGDKFQTKAKIVTLGMKNRQCTADLMYFGADANIIAKVVDGSTAVLDSFTLVTQTDYRVTPRFVFPCPLNPETAFIELEATADAAPITMDTFHLGITSQQVGAVGSKALVAGYSSTDQTALTHASNVLIDMDTEEYDSEGDFNTTTSIFTAPYAGKYHVSGSVYILPTSASNLRQGTLLLYKNGSLLKIGNSAEHVEVTSGNHLNKERTTVSTTVELVEGDTLSFYGTATTWNGGTWYIAAGSANTYFSIDLVEIEGGSVYLVNDSVQYAAAKFSANGLTSATSAVSGSDAFITTWDNVSITGGGSFDGESYTVPANGKYRIVSRVRWNGTFSSTDTTLRVFKNGTQISRIHYPFSSANAPSMAIEYVEDFLKGDLIKIGIRQGSGSTQILRTAIEEHHFSITRTQDHSAGSSSGFLFASAEKHGLVKLNKWERKHLTVDAVADGTVADLTFPNLIVGEVYEVSGMVDFGLNIGSVDAAAQLTMVHDSITIGFMRAQSRSGQTTTDIYQSPIAGMFTATATSLTFVGGSLSVGSRIRSGLDKTFVIVKKCVTCSKTSGL